MSEFDRCKACHGAKKVVGLGMMERNCKACNGIGYLTAETRVELPLPRLDELSVKPVELSAIDITKIKRRK